MANDNLFTRRDGSQVKVEPYVISASEMTSILRLQEDFVARGEHLSVKGVILHIIDRGITSTHHYWDAAAKNKNQRDFAKSAASCFNSDGSVRDAEGLMKLAIAKGIVKGSPKQVSNPVAPEPSAAEVELTVEQLEAATSPSNGVPPVPSEG